MSGAPFEAALELWASSLRAAKARMRPVFGQERAARSAGKIANCQIGVFAAYVSRPMSRGMAMR